MAAGKRLFEVAEVGLGAAEDGGRVVIARVWALVAGDDDRGVERLDLLDGTTNTSSLSGLDMAAPFRAMWRCGPLAELTSAASHLVADGGADPVVA